MLTRANCASSESNWRKRRSRSWGRLVAALGPEQDRDAEGHNRSEEDPPGKFHDGQPIGLRVILSAKEVGDLVRQAAKDRDRNEAEDHGENVTEIVSTPLRQHPCEEDAEKRTIGISKNTQDDRDNSHVGIHD